MNLITESEEKRLRSLKEKKQVFKTKGQLIQQALSNLDNATNNKKIIFDDLNEGQQKLKSKKETKRDLFDSDNDNNNEQDSLWDENEFKAKKAKKTFGNDARFTLDDRFMENDCQNEESKVIDGTEECDLQKEKEKQLDILEGILGTPLVKNQKIKSTKKGMIRYDPTENGHYEYEVKPAQPETKEKSKKKKRDKLIVEIEEPVLPEPKVSKDIYYTVSNNLTESLKQKEEFSLLKAHRKEKNNIEDTKDNDTSIVENNEAQRFKFNFNANNVFKYDSSDNENTHEIPDNQIVDEAEEDTQQNSLFGQKDTLFFNNNDVRFNEAIKFFSTKAASNDEFNNLRRELKTIVRAKVRNNERKRQPYGKKRKIKRSQ